MGGAMAKVFVTRRLPGEALTRLGSEHEIELWEGVLPPPPQSLRAGVRDAEGLLSLLTDRVDSDLLDRAPRLRVIANYAVGTDNIDLAECASRGIAVGNTPGVLTEATADLTFALILAAGRRLAAGIDAVRAGEWRTWEPAGWLGAEVHGSTLGVVGPGAIGSAVARRAEGFGMHVLAAGRPGKPGLEPLERVLEEADFLSLHAPLTEETRGLIGAAELEAMKPTATLVNTARGELVDTDALTLALLEAKIAAAGLDVTDPEPLPADHPLLAAPNVIVLPHIGSASRAARSAMADLAVDNLLTGLAGRPLPAPVQPR
jgi:glyoxylate reductase